MADSRSDDENLPPLLRSPLLIDKTNVKELKEFLRQHRQPVDGRSQQLKERAKDVIAMGISSNEILKQQDKRDSERQEARRFVSPLREILPHP